jgi:hypothetical protein
MPALTFVKLYPAEGDSAVAELHYGGEIWGDIRLEKLNLHARGEARLEDADVVLRVYPRAKPRSAFTAWMSRRRRSTPRVASDEPWEWNLDDLMAVLNEARAWLLENERGREPVSAGALTAAGSALSKASAESSRPSR